MRFATAVLVLAYVAALEVAPDLAVVLLLAAVLSAAAQVVVRLSEWVAS